MQREGEDDAWRAIVENFGERAELDDDPADLPLDEHVDPPATPPSPTRRADPYAWAVDDEPDEPEDRAPAYAEDADTYVPPPPPPLPVPEPDRGIAWIGVIGSPLLLLASLVLGLDLPTWVGYLMIAWFVGGFCYLVARMPKEPRDPWDYGSRV